MILHKDFGMILVLAAHADDETLGCGGTISKLISQSFNCHIHVVTGHGKNKHPIFKNELFEKVRCEFKNAMTHLGSPSYSFGDLPAAMLNDIPTYLINYEIQNIVSKINPNTVFIPSKKDLHLDHKIINYASKVALRPYLKNNSNLFNIIEYEVPSETGIFMDDSNDNFAPNLYFDISEQIENKLKAFSEYKSQIQESNQPRSINGIKNLATYRGINIGVNFAESFNIVFQKN